MNAKISTCIYFISAVLLILNGLIPYSGAVHSDEIVSDQDLANLEQLESAIEFPEHISNEKRSDKATKDLVNSLVNKLKDIHAVNSRPRFGKREYMESINDIIKK
jgi:hypothetical protein